MADTCPNYKTRWKGKVVHCPTPELFMQVLNIIGNYYGLSEETWKQYYKNNTCLNIETGRYGEKSTYQKGDYYQRDIISASDFIQQETGPDADIVTNYSIF